MTRAAFLELSDVSDAQAAALVFAVDPYGLGGVAVRSGAGPLREHWLRHLQALMPAGSPWRRLPTGTTDARLDGGLDLAATLAGGRPVIQRGLLADGDGGTIVVAMAERLPEPHAARLAAALDTGLCSRGDQARFGLVALDEGLDDEGLSTRLGDRLAFWTDLSGYDPGETWPEAENLVVAARVRLASVTTGDPVLRALTEAGAALGIDSLRPLTMATRAARAAAALAGRDDVDPKDAALAARLVLAPRATQIPTAPEQQRDEPDTGPDKNETQEGPQSDASGGRDGLNGNASDQDAPDHAGSDAALSDLVVAAAKAALPPGLLLHLKSNAGRTARQAPGRAGAVQTSAKRGRPAGVQRDAPRGTTRLNVIETLRAAAPWQTIRKRMDAAVSSYRRIEIRRDDFRYTRFKHRTETVTLFAVDASGSLALNRLAEAKGAVELLLAECYVRRDQVALLAFRGSRAELLLPPTRSLTRAKRCLANLAGGGATPLAAAIDAAVAIADQIRRRGRTPVIVFLTDGRANVARDGTAGRAVAEADTRAAARAAGASGMRILVVDAAQRPQPPARALAVTMNATYLPLPRAEANALTAAIRTVTAG